MKLRDFLDLIETRDAWSTAELKAAILDFLVKDAEIQLSKPQPRQLYQDK